MTPPKVKAVIWDIDGTLIDSEPLHLDALLGVCDSHCVDISDLSDDHFVGVNLHGVWKALHKRFPVYLTMETWVSELNSIYATGAAKLMQIPDAVIVIQSLAGAGIRQAAASNSNRAVVDTNLATLGVTDVLEFSLSLDDVANGKPSPELYLSALERLGLNPDQAIAIEDSKTGVTSAKAAGLKVLGLGMSNLGADQKINGLPEILPIIGAANSARQ